MATNPILGLDVYIALAAVGWADGQLTRQAADAILRTAAEAVSYTHPTPPTSALV